MARRIVLDFSQFVETFAANGGILLLQQAFVGDRLRLHIFDGSRAPLPVETIKQRVGIAAVRNVNELARQRDPVLESAVHAHTADRIIDVRRIAGEQNPAAAEAPGDPLMHVVHVAVDDWIWPRVEAFAEAGVDPFVAHHLLIAFLGFGGKYAAPEALSILA